MIYHSIDELIGNTPLLEIGSLGKAYGVGARLLAKLECFNPAGSAKDRIAKGMIDAAVATGRLKDGGTIIEPTSGNTGIGLAAVGVPRGYTVVLTMPDTMSVERRSLLKAYGAKVVLTPGPEGMAGAIAKAEELAAEIPGSFLPRQFENPENPTAHRTATGPEIWRDTEGRVDIFVAGVGTGGTITGVGEFLKQQNPAIKIVAAEPYDSQVLGGGEAGPHGIMGIGANFLPKALNTNIYDEILPVKTKDAYELGRGLVRHEGILAGISSGAALWAAVQVGARPENAGKTVVVLLPDTGERYLSTPMFQEG